MNFCINTPTFLRARTIKYHHCQIMMAKHTFPNLGIQTLQWYKLLYVYRSGSDTQPHFTVHSDSMLPRLQVLLHHNSLTLVIFMCSVFLESRYCFMSLASLLFISVSSLKIIFSVSTGSITLQSGKSLLLCNYKINTQHEHAAFIFTDPHP